jgi:hypothetical protein
VDNRYGAIASELADTADIARRDEIRPNGRDIYQLAIAERRCDIWLQYVVGSGRAAADMPLGHFDRLEPRRGE